MISRHIFLCCYSTHLTETEHRDVA